MKKWLMSFMVPVLISTASLSANAANCKTEDSIRKFNNGVIVIRQNQSQQTEQRSDYGFENNYAKNYANQGNANDNDWEKGRWGNNRNDRRDRRDHRDNDRREDRFREREDARYVINRTAPVIFRAQRVARMKHYYAGFGRAVAHQNKARELYEARRYRDAIFHSLRARKLAMMVIKGNRDNWSGHPWDERENRYGRITPNDHDLDIRVDWHKVGKDEAAVRLQFIFNVK